MKIPHLPQVTLPQSSPLDAEVASKLKRASDTYMPPEQLDKYKEMDNAPIIPYENPFKGRNASNIDLPKYIGMRHYRITSSAIEMGNPHKERTYQYGELTDNEDINAFLDQLERLEGEHKVMLEHIKPSKELLELTQKLSDEELAQFAEYMVELSNVFLFTGKDKVDSSDLISALNNLSEEALSSTIEAMGKVLEQGDSYEMISSPIGEDEYGKEDLLFSAYKDGMLLQEGYSAGGQGRKLAQNFAKLIIDDKLSDGQLIEFNAHISESNLEQSRGMIDIASVLKKHQLEDMLSMLSEADKEDEQNVFAYLGQQVSHQAHKQYYQTEKGDFIAQINDTASESERRELYDDVLTAYNEFGLGWINDTLKEVKDTPAQIQKDIWHKLLEDKDAQPNDFIKSDSLETWAAHNVAGIEAQFHHQQIMKIHAFNNERVLPDVITGLRFFASGNSRLHGVDTEQKAAAT